MNAHRSAILFAAAFLGLVIGWAASHVANGRAFDVFLETHQCVERVSA